MNKANTRTIANKQLVSIITPSFNQGKYIEATIKSVLSQDYPHIEYLIFDGGSTDNTLEILKKYKDKVKIISETDKGQSDAVNKGFNASKGAILGWLNSDDTYEPGAVKAVVEHFEANPDLMMIYGKGAHVYEDGTFMEWYPTEPFSLQRLAEICFMCQPAVFLRAQIFNTMDMLNIELNYCMDYELWIRIAKQFKVGYLQKHLANTRLYDDTKTMSKRVEAHAEIIRMVKEHFGVCPMNWVYAYTHYVLDRFLTRDTKIKNLTYMGLLTLLVPYYNLRFNKSWPRFKETKELFGRFVKHKKSKGLRNF